MPSSIHHPGAVLSSPPAQAIPAAHRGDLTLPGPLLALAQGTLPCSSLSQPEGKKNPTKLKNPKPHTISQDLRGFGAEHLCAPTDVCICLSKGNRDGFFFSLCYFLFYFNSLPAFGASQDAGTRINTRKKKENKKKGGGTSRDHHFAQGLGVQRDSPRASGATSPVRSRSWELGVSHTPALLWLWYPGPIPALSSQNPCRGLPRVSSPSSNNLGNSLCMEKPEMHLKTSQNSGPQALKTKPQPCHRQSLSKQLQLPKQLRLPVTSAPAWSSSPCTENKRLPGQPRSCRANILGSMGLTQAQVGNPIPARPAESWEMLLGIWDGGEGTCFSRWHFRQPPLDLSPSHCMYARSTQLSDR